MPPKRQPTASGSGQAKKRRGAPATETPASTSAAAPPHPTLIAAARPSPLPVRTAPPTRDRWAPVSGSKNAAADYAMRCGRPNAFEYFTICKPFYVMDAEDSEEEEEEEEDGDEDEGGEGDADGEEDEEDDDEVDEDENENGAIAKGKQKESDKQNAGKNQGGDKDKDDVDDRPGPRCSRNKDCICFKPIAENPGHPWRLSLAGFFKFENQFIHAQLRDPDNFDMYVFNKYSFYGMLEIIQNLFLDYSEAEGDWRQQWAVCEGVVQFFSHSLGMRLAMVPDPEIIQKTAELTGRMFLHMLALLDEQGLLTNNSAVRSLGCTMAQYMVLAYTWRCENIVEQKPREKYYGKRPLQPAFFEDAIFSYAVQRGITMHGPTSLEEVVSQARPGPTLPLAGVKDPWNFRSHFFHYEFKYSGLLTFMIGDKGTSFGGDALDITTWSSSRRKKAAFNKKDPLGAKDIKALKEGMVMQMGYR